MSAATSKTSKAESAKKSAVLKKGIVAKTTTVTKKATPKALSLTTIKAKKVRQPLTKKEYVEPLSPAKIRNAKPVNKEKALTKEELAKRQKSKGTSRKQGGKKFSALKADQLKTMANIPEAAPTKVD